MTEGAVWYVRTGTDKTDNPPLLGRPRMLVLTLLIANSADPALPSPLEGLCTTQDFRLRSRPARAVPPF